MRITVNGCTLAVHDGGHGTSLILLHGFPMSSAIFTPIRPTLEQPAAAGAAMAAFLSDLSRN